MHADADIGGELQRATIEIVDPPRQLTLRWQPDPMYPAVALLNTFFLEEENSGTRATVTQAGYESLPGDVRQSWVDRDAGAYTTIMEQLKAYSERT